MESCFAPYLDWLDGERQSMIDETIKLAEINSDSLNVEGVNAVGQRVAALCERELELAPDFVALEPLDQVNDRGDHHRIELGRAVRCSYRPEAPLRVFFCAHLDTVFAADDPFQHCRWLDEHTLNGPGVTDLKGGILVMVKALAALKRSPWGAALGWELLFNPDEEIGSPGSAPLIATAARGCRLGLVYEPCFPDGNLAGARKGSGNFSLVVHGRSAHAGREHHLGRNAIRALADFVSSLDDLNGRRPGLTVNPGFIRGGGAVNAVPDRALCRFNVRLEQAGDDRWFEQQLQGLVDALNDRDGIRAELHGGFSRPPKPLTDTNRRLLDLALDCGRQLGMDLEYLPTGGCCDGNNLAALGIANIDTLGVRGGAIHSRDEFLDVRSLVPRAQLSALLLMRLARGEGLDGLDSGGANHA